MFQIKGLDRLQKELKEAQYAISELDVDGAIGTVVFDPQDPHSIEVAVQTVNQIIDQRVGQYASNQLVAPIIEQLKERYRESLLQKAAEARLDTEED